MIHTLFTSMRYKRSQIVAVNAQCAPFFSRNSPQNLFFDQDEKTQSSANAKRYECAQWFARYLLNTLCTATGMVPVMREY